MAKGDASWTTSTSVLYAYFKYGLRYKSLLDINYPVTPFGIGRWASIAEAGEPEMHALIQRMESEIAHGNFTTVTQGEYPTVEQGLFIAAMFVQKRLRQNGVVLNINPAELSSHL